VPVDFLLGNGAPTGEAEYTFWVVSKYLFKTISARKIDIFLPPESKAFLRE